MKSYQTIQGDTWDTIAKAAYGNEKRMDILMAANFPLLDHFIFPAGIRVTIPELVDQDGYEMPEWRKIN